MFISDIDDMAEGGWNEDMGFWEDFEENEFCPEVENPD